MKIRILDNAIRLRLDRSEVDRIGTGKAVTARTRFPGAATFTYRLAVAEQPDTTARFDDGTMLVTLAGEQARSWASDETRVSIKAAETLTDGDTLQLLVEKDFECLEPRSGEDQSNRFVNPKATA